LHGVIEKTNLAACHTRFDVSLSHIATEVPNFAKNRENSVLQPAILPGIDSQNRKSQKEKSGKIGKKIAKIRF